MGESRRKDEERRKSPRFNVGGWATVHCLPLEGRPIPALVRNLSAGGICLDVKRVLEMGTQTDLLVCVSKASFRAAALVREQRELSKTCLQFLQITQRGREILEELIARLREVQILSRKLRSAESDEEIKQALLDKGRFRLLAVGENERSAVGDGPESSKVSLCIPSNESATESKALLFKPRLLEIDIFG
jgi:PilZ domain